MRVLAPVFGNDRGVMFELFNGMNASGELIYLNPNMNGALPRLRAYPFFFH